MDNKVVNNNYAGIGFCGLLTIVFIVLKLCGIINWSWIWVLSPIWISFILSILIVLIIFLVAILVTPKGGGKD